MCSVRSGVLIDEKAGCHFFRDGVDDTVREPLWEPSVFTACDENRWQRVVFVSLLVLKSAPPEFVWRSIASASRTVNPDHLSMLINQRKPNSASPLSSATMKSSTKGKRFSSVNERWRPSLLFKKAPIVADLPLNLFTLSRSHCQCKQMPLRGSLSVSYLCMGW